ncbi:MAG: hypothetical protein F6K49_32815 [Moorea sp. SIO3I6]|nr:hypothetical protein [Moorena sp. SIO3I6]
MISCHLFLVYSPYSLLPTPYSLLPTPYSLLKYHKHLSGSKAKGSRVNDAPLLKEMVTTNFWFQLPATATWR